MAGPDCQLPDRFFGAYGFENDQPVDQQDDIDLAGIVDRLLAEAFGSSIVAESVDYSAALAIIGSVGVGPMLVDTELAK